MELGRFAAGPACATVLADWGAEVVKVEPPGGDPARGPGAVSVDGEPPTNPRFEVHNRSRRSVVLDLATPAGRQALDRLLSGSDVFVTNLSPGALQRLGLDGPTLRARHPRLVVAQVSGYDPGSVEADRRSYDHGAFWSYSGVGSLFAGPGGEPPQPTGGFGDRAAGSMLAGGVAAALLGRARTGEGALVTTSLVGTALWLAASEVSDVLATGTGHHGADRTHAPIPTLNCFRAGDGRWIWLQVMEPQLCWADLVTALDAPWLDEDPRFRGGALTALRAYREPLLELLDEIFRGRASDEWLARLRSHDIVATPVRTLQETVTDPDLRRTHAVVEFTDELGRRHVTVNSPCVFDGRTPGAATRAPHVGEHTARVLREAGVPYADLDTPATDGATCAPDAGPPSVTG